MRKLRRTTVDNQGSTLVLIVICVAFISVLCSFLLSVSMTNRQMKTIERKAKGNFYSTETALDEINAGLEEIAASALEVSYVTVMEQFLMKSEEEKKQLLANTFLDTLETRLSVVSGYYEIDTIRAFITNSSASLITMEGENRIDKNGERITLKNIKISYTSAEGYSNKISTDIVFRIPKTELGASYTSPVYSEYALIADHRILLYNQPNVSVYGSVYAGEGGISLDNASSLALRSGKNVITRGDIKVKERSSLKIMDNPKIWARNIATLKEDFDTTQATEINIEGDCYIADDLTLNSKNSKVTMKGDYYGYSYESYLNSPLEYPHQAAKSSAILINGKEAMLDLGEVKKLFLAGRAYLDPTYDGNANTDIYTGEALSVKSFQYAYLVPAECLWCGINPVPEDLYDTLTPSDTEVDLDKALTIPYPVTITDYADGYSKMIYNVSGQKITYYYLKFKSEAHANLYVQKYFDYYQTGAGAGTVSIDQRIASNLDHHSTERKDKIKLNPSFDSLITAANLFAYHSEDGTKLLQNNVDMEQTAGGENSESRKALEQVSRQLVKRYDSMVQNLLPVATNPPYDRNSLFHSIIHTENLIAHVEDVTKIILGDYVVYLVNNKVGTSSEYEYVLTDDLNLPGNGKKGMVIATGKVNVSGNFEGLILAGQEITLNAGAMISASKKIVDEILGFRNLEVNRCFRGYADATVVGTGSTLETIKISDFIVYQNWKKY